MGKKKNVINNEKNKNTVSLKKEIKQNINNLEESNEIELKEENIKKEVQKGCNCKKDKTSKSTYESMVGYTWNGYSYGDE